MFLTVQKQENLFFQFPVWRIYVPALPHLRQDPYWVPFGIKYLFGFRGILPRQAAEWANGCSVYFCKMALLKGKWRVISGGAAAVGFPLFIILLRF